MARHFRILALLCVGSASLLGAARTPAGECLIFDYPAMSPTQMLASGPVATAVVRTVARKRAQSVGSAASPREQAAAQAPPQDLKHAIWGAIERRDLKAFLRAVPKDPDARRAALRQSLALDSAFRAGSLPIARRILEWDPDEIRERWANSNSIGLQSVVEAWSAQHYFADNGEPIENPPPEDDFVELMRMLLKAGASPDGWMLRQPALGILAALPSSPQTLIAAQLLIAAGADVNASRPSWPAPLVFAAEAQNPDLAQQLLDTHHLTQESLDAALVRTPITESNPVLPLLLAAGADINTHLTTGPDPRSIFTPALDAARRFNREGGNDLMQQMIRLKADPNRLYNPGIIDSPLMLVIPDLPTTRALVELGADVRYHNASGDTPLRLAVRTAEPESVPRVRLQLAQLLLEHGADASADNKSGDSPLKETRSGDDPLVALLLAHGGTWRLTPEDVRGYSVPIGRYDWALLHRKESLAVAMAVHGEKPAAEDCGVIYYAASSGSERVLGALLAHHLGEVEVRDSAGRTPLMAAASHGEVGTLRLLLDRHAARVDARTPRGVVAKGFAFQGGPGLAPPVLIGGASALMFAALNNQSAAVEELIRRGADVNARDIDARTPLAYAESSGAQESVSVLRAHGGKD